MAFENSALREKCPFDAQDRPGDAPRRYPLLTPTCRPPTPGAMVLDVLAVVLTGDLDEEGLGAWNQAWRHYKRSVF